MKNYIHILSTIAILLSGCNNSIEDLNPSSKKPISHAYISCYITSIDSLRETHTKQDSMLNINILAQGEMEFYSNINFNFHQIAQYYGDTAYYNNEWPENIYIIADSIKEINFYSLDNKFPFKKQCLNKTTYIEYQSYYDFIKSNYNSNIETNYKYLLFKFNNKNTKLLSNIFSLSTDLKLIDNIKIFQVEVKTFSGIMLKKTIEISK